MGQKYQELSASSLYRAEVCPASFALPTVKQSSNIDAERGQALHKYLELVINSGGEADTSIAMIAPQYREDCIAIDLTKIPIGQVYLTEVGHILELKTLAAQERTQGDDRFAVYNLVKSLRRTNPEYQYISGIADLVIRSQDETGVLLEIILDYKTGQGSNLDHPKYNLQLLFHAVARYLKATKEGKAIKVAVGLFYTEKNNIIIEELTMEDIRAAIIRLRRIYAGVQEARAIIADKQIPNTYPTTSCQYCSSMLHCPSYVNFSRQLTDEQLSLIGGIEMAVSDQQLGQVWERILTMEKLIEQIKPLIKLRASKKPIELSNGSMLGAFETKTQTVQETAYDAMVEAYGKESADACANKKITLEKIKTYFGKAEAVDIIKALQGGAHIKNITYLKVKEFKQKPHSQAELFDAPE